jgi:hypothetical protein
LCLRLSSCLITIHGDPALYRSGGFFQEKVVFPFEDWLFHFLPQSRVDIWSHGLTGAEQLDSINAEYLLLPAELAAPVGG